MADIFISYSHDDSDYAHRLARALEKQGLSAWIDDRIDYGTRWLHEIETHIDDCGAVIVIMTPHSKESDWVQNEWLYARDKKKPIYALLLEDEAWLAFRSTQYVDVRGGKLPPADFYTRLKGVTPKIASPEISASRAGMSSAQNLAAAPAQHMTKSPVSDIQIWGGVEFVRIPAGKFLMGSKDDNKLAQDNEKPQHHVEIAYDYWMARYPVTNEQFARFVEEAAYKFSLGKSWMGKVDHPVVAVSWHGALEYCKWLNTVIASDIQMIKAQVRLPTEAEWEKAARGDAQRGNEWPWGNEFDKTKCNSSEGKKGGTTPVGAYSPQGDSPYGVADMAGNVWEWCHSLFKPYPYKMDDGREDESASGTRVLRGGSFDLDRRLVRCASRYDSSPDNRLGYVGFRGVVSPGF